MELLQEVPQVVLHLDLLVQSLVQLRAQPLDW
ncbi:hypothetical protein DFR38_101171 [Aquitalea magnusonii]|uniref:Uncharacterized protein n=1 Tax=Aquitalea magnusonii TaxID=332411 RepID=A0A318JMF8_9NEIS|nr:hypothetical protein DFR38_101171 [Aquitalea magnusonii]